LKEPTSSRPARVALLYPGDRAMRDRADPAESRFAALFDALRDSRIDAFPAVYNDAFADEVEAQLRDVDLVQVWCNPIQDGNRRDKLDAMLRRLADRGVHVSAHPDAVLALGTKDVLLAARDLPFGSDTHRIGSLEELGADLPRRLDGGPRVLKQHRGHSGIGIWRVEWADRTSKLVRVKHAERGSEQETVSLPVLKERLAAYFEPEAGGHMIDQAWQPRVTEGMVRAYLVGDRVAGFGVQALIALNPESPATGPRLYHGADVEQGRRLKTLLETEWVDMLRASVGLPREKLPLLWDCDFMHGEDGGYVLCEINVSSVSPFPPSAIPEMVTAIRRACTLQKP
jgi:hypothetical protein